MKIEIKKTDELIYTLDNINNTIDALVLIEKQMLEKNSTDFDIQNRIAELEVKMSKLWNILITKTPTGEDKPTKYAKSKFNPLVLK